MIMQGVIGRMARMDDETMASRAGQLFSAALDAMEDGVAVHDGAGRLVFANRALRAIAAAEDGIALDERAGPLPVDPALRRRFAMALAAACAGAAVEVAVPRRSGGAPLVLACRPLPAGVAGAMVMVADPARRRVPSPTLLRHAFGLTPTEAELAGSLISGLTVPECAAARRVSPNTVRSQVRALLSKTGSRRQVDLVALLSGLGNAMPRAA